MPDASTGCLSIAQPDLQRLDPASWVATGPVYEEGLTTTDRQPRREGAGGRHRELRGARIALLSAWLSWR